MVLNVSHGVISHGVKVFIHEHPSGSDKQKEPVYEFEYEIDWVKRCSLIVATYDHVHQY